MTRNRMLAFTLAAAYAGCSAIAQTSPSTDPAASTYKANCAMCHNSDGAGSELGKRFGAPDLRSKDIQDKPQAALVQSIRNGKNKMPAFGDRLDEAQVIQLVEYVRTFRADSTASKPQ